MTQSTMKHHRGKKVSNLSEKNRRYVADAAAKKTIIAGKMKVKGNRRRSSREKNCKENAKNLFLPFYYPIKSPVSQHKSIPRGTRKNGKLKNNKKLDLNPRKFFVFYPQS
jgi:hypothetical protein